MRGVLDLIEENNHDIQRTSSVSRSVLANFRCYHEMLQEKQQKTVQMTIVQEERERRTAPKRGTTRGRAARGGIMKGKRVKVEE